MTRSIGEPGSRGKLTFDDDDTDDAPAVTRFVPRMTDSSAHPAVPVCDAGGYSHSRGSAWEWVEKGSLQPQGGRPDPRNALFVPSRRKGSSCEAPLRPAVCP